ncbi:class I SAM-dependent methyltransferase [Paenibacillus sp. ACRRX]|uniref:class I SAM-dependent methyltransferase n=1 Tax=Paenibacillus sp. ACRRX TaxID=2918206 RepID=UPI001EF3FC2A|nr:class I SAM-dependent methyltransferase [Paenibacillus sp. ACRRX]MCG7409608.1 class I SAM-dependent methyltransferase [Paenibacillus sp. ACRRX]
MKAFDSVAYYDKVGRINGWDFSQMKLTSEGIGWDFYQEVVRACIPSDFLLDIGTGGGEAVLAIADSAQLIVGIDHSSGMIKTAVQNLNRAGIPNVRFMQMDAEKLLFPNEFYNVVSCRHSGFYAEEVARVLAPDGLFMTQQVGERDKINLKAAFGRGQAYESMPETLMRGYIAELSAAGFRDIQFDQYYATEYYETPEDLLFLLTHTPIIPNFGEVKGDMEVFEQFVADHMTAQGIITNAERFMIAARRRG